VHHLSHNPTIFGGSAGIKQHRELSRVRVIARNIESKCCDFAKIMSSVFSDLTVAQLKEKLREFDQPTSGSKAELIARLLEIDPTGECASRGEDELVAGVLVKNDSASRSHGAVENESEKMLKQMDMMRKEKELVERELRIVQREIELLRQIQQLNISQSDARRATEVTNELTNTPRMNITAIADLLSDFDGSTNTFDR